MKNKRLGPYSTDPAKIKNMQNNLYTQMRAFEYKGKKLKDPNKSKTNTLHEKQDEQIKNTIAILTDNSDKLIMENRMLRKRLEAMDTKLRRESNRVTLLEREFSKLGYVVNKILEEDEKNVKKRR